jgi:hypothetical protein
LQLSSVDLLKNRLYSMADDRIAEVIEKWQSMTGTIETLPRPEETQMDYVRHTWIAMHGHVRDRFLYDKIRDVITNKQRAIEFSVHLASNAPLYAALFNPSSEIWSAYPASARRQLAALGAYGVKQVRPMLMAALAKFTQKEMIKLLDAAVCWTVRCSMANVGGGSLEVHYNRRAHEITTGSIKSTDAAAAAMRDIVPDDARFKAAVSTVTIRWSELARYYLQVLQRQADGEAEPQYVPNEAADEITLEHILPQDLKAACWEGIPFNERAPNCYRLGNLVLLQATPNSKLSNGSYAEKKPELRKSKFSLTKETAGFSKWGPEQIAKRQEKLADLALKAWPLT